MVPTKSPGTLFSSLTTEQTLLIRWLMPTDPVFYEVLNRPIADVALRQLIIAKAVDSIQTRLGHQALFPFVVQPKIASGSNEADFPVGMIWDMHASLPKKWEKLRLSKIKRMSGVNSTTDGYNGTLRLIFSASLENSTVETSIFYADYVIDSDLTYQPLRLNVVTDSEESNSIDPSEVETVSGFIMFRTMELTEQVQAFYDLLEPPVNATDGDSNGFYDNPSVYEIVDTVSGGTAVTDDYSAISLVHGTGLLTDSTLNSIPQLNSDVQSWLSAMNYPFDASANRKSVDNITIPSGLFREFEIVAPAGDQPSGDISGTFYPVWINRIERVGTGSQNLRFYFATYNITDSSPNSNNPIEFAALDLLDSYVGGNIIEIIPIDDLLLRPSNDADYRQHFGRGHVVLSSLWDGTNTVISDFFNAFDNIVETPPDTVFTQSSTRISSFGISRVPKYVPTVGQSRAMSGSTSRRTTPIQPNDDNRFVCEQDQGLGNQVDLESQPGISPNQAIDRYGYSGGLAHKIVRLTINATSLGNDPNFYTTQVLPRLRVLFGRDPAFGDFWYNGTRLMFYNGDSWQG